MSTTRVNGHSAAHPIPPSLLPPPAAPSPGPRSPLSALSADSIYFSPLPPNHAPRAGKENHGRYMLSVPWSRVSGWGQAVIEGHRPLELDPFSGVCQYAVTCFEGMKCYRNPQTGDLRLFRPRDNFNRFKRSAARVGLPYDWDNEVLLQLLDKLLALEKELVPIEPGSSLYIRPTLLETSESFGIKSDATAANALLFFVTTLNLGMPLYNSCDAPENGLRLDACTEYIRAWPGGTGTYKLGANYGPVSVAKKEGYHMSLWLHGEEDYVAEAGAMNMWMIKEAQDGYLDFTTMPLSTGVVLPGVTRASILSLLRNHAASVSSSEAPEGVSRKAFPIDGMPDKIRVVERDFAMAEVVSALEDGSLKGMFGCGTGVVVVSVGLIQYQGKQHTIPYSTLPKLLRDAISGIQRGEIEYEGWGHKCVDWAKGRMGEQKVEGSQVYA